MYAGGGCIFALYVELWREHNLGSNVTRNNNDPLLSQHAGSHAETTVDSDEGKRRSLATGSGMFCVASQGADQAALQAGLNWACGPGHADCTAIQPGGTCYKQNNLQALASYAYNDYYQRSTKASTACDFNGTATTTTTDPSKHPRSSCVTLPLSLSNVSFRRSLLVVYMYKMLVSRLYQGSVSGNLALELCQSSDSKTPQHN
jgi:hypothetical protein